LHDLVINVQNGCVIFHPHSTGMENKPEIMTLTYGWKIVNGATNCLSTRRENNIHAAKYSHGCI